ncbi:hypothetical protein SAMN04489718_0551 [Actinopolyspora saharensis]|uniref:Uncharacterized protein n=1 Tax=Actinopolyspora saharensis TaxID=995062 RepID=A0A1H0YMB8_9ACTN|nr:hypothetical protein SAMN04489718_0551 [Actinopolyspora saharensis]
MPGNVVLSPRRCALQVLPEGRCGSDEEVEQAVPQRPDEQLFD